MSKSYEREQVQDELIFNVTEDLLIAMEDAGVTKAELARRLNKSKSRVSQMLSGDANITLRTLASMCFELGVGVDVRIGNEFSVRDPRSAPDWKHDEFNSLYAEYPSHELKDVGFQLISLVECRKDIAAERPCNDDICNPYDDYYELAQA